VLRFVCIDLQQPTNGCDSVNKDLKIKADIYCFWFSTRPEILLQVFNYES